MRSPVFVDLVSLLTSVVAQRENIILHTAVGVVDHVMKRRGR